MCMYVIFKILPYVTIPKHIMHDYNTYDERMVDDVQDMNYFSIVLDKEYELRRIIQFAYHMILSCHIMMH